MKPPEQWLDEAPVGHHPQFMLEWIKRIQDDAVESAMLKMPDSFTRGLEQCRLMEVTDAISSDQCKATVSTKQ